MNAPSHRPLGSAVDAVDAVAASITEPLVDATDELAPVAALPIAVVAIVLITIAAALMVGSDFNLDAFVAIQQVTRVWPDRAWAALTLCGNGAVAFALMSPTLAWQPRRYAAALPAAAFAGLYSNALKHVFALPRPAAVLDPLHLHVIGERLTANSFPSGHSVTAFTLAAVFVLASRRPLATAAWAVPFATLVALSRIAVGAHWPADIAAGAAGGWVAGALGVVVVARWRRWNTTTGVRLLGVVAVGVGLALFASDFGYRIVLPLQWCAGGLSIAFGLVAIARPRLDALLPPRPLAGTSAPA